MVSIRAAQVDDLVGIQAANLHCLPENYQMRCDTRQQDRCQCVDARCMVSSLWSGRTRRMEHTAGALIGSERLVSHGVLVACRRTRHRSLRGFGVVLRHRVTRHRRRPCGYTRRPCRPAPSASCARAGTTSTTSCRGRSSSTSPKTTMARSSATCWRRCACARRA